MPPKTAPAPAAPAADAPTADVTPAGGGGIVDFKLPEPEGPETFLSSVAPRLDEVFSRLEKGLSLDDIVGSTPAETPKATPETPAAPETPSSEAAKTGPESDAKIDAPGPLADIPDDLTDWTPQAAKRYKEVSEELTQTRARAEELDQKVKEYESRVAEMEALSADEKFKQLTERLAEYDRKMALIDIEQTTAFQETVLKPTMALIEQAEEIGGRYGVDPEIVADLLSETDPDAQSERVSELFPKITDRDKVKLYRIMEDIEPLRARRAALQSGAEEALKEAKLLEEERVKAEARERAETRKAAAKNVMSRISDKLPFLAKAEGVDLTAIESKAAEVDPSVAHPVDLAYNAAAGQLLPVMARQYLGLRKEVEALTARLAEFDAAEPRAPGASRVTGSPGPVNDELSFEEAVSRRLASLGV